MKRTVILLRGKWRFGVLLYNAFRDTCFLEDGQLIVDAIERGEHSPELHGNVPLVIDVQAEFRTIEARVGNEITGERDDHARFEYALERPGAIAGIEAGPHEMFR
jgi:hypothetical protein